MDALAAILNPERRRYRPMGNFISWLFVDAQTEAGGPNGDPTPFNPTWWIVVMGLLLLAAIYYFAEGRRKIPWIKDHTIRKYILDRMVPQAAWLGGVGLIIVACRLLLFYSFFSWRIWLALWLVWAAVLVGYWIYFFIVKHPAMDVAYRTMLERNKFIPSANKNKRRTATARR
jgi:hypothetical protein